MGFCAGHFLRPEEHKDYVDKFGVGGCMFKPPSVIIKEAFYNLIKNDHVLSDSHLQEVAKRTLLSGGAEYARGSPAIDGTTAKGRCLKSSLHQGKEKSGKYAFCLFNSIRT